MRTAPPVTAPPPDAPQPAAGKPGKAGAGDVPTSARQRTAQQVLVWTWDRAFVGQLPDGDRQARYAAACAALAGSDPRPLLVLRECESCAGTEDAFLSREFDNERTILYGRWFHAIKLPAEVLSPEHPLHVLFDGASPPHLFMSAADGSGRQELDGQQSQARLWSAMTKVLKSAYEKDPVRAAKELQKVLGQLDLVDTRLALIEERIATEAAARGSEAKSTLKLHAERDEILERRAALIEEGAVIDELKLRPAAP